MDGTLWLKPDTEVWVQEGGSDDQAIIKLESLTIYGSFALFESLRVALERGLEAARDDRIFNRSLGEL